MGVDLTIRAVCNGCGAEDTRTVHLFGGEIRDFRLDDQAPSGWWLRDPWTRATYCPSCRADIERTGKEEGDE